MGRAIEIELTREIVSPLVDRIRVEANRLRETEEASIKGPTGRSAIDDVEELVDLFPPDFPSTNTIRIGSFQAPGILRACSFLRLRLRTQELASIPDAELEAGDKNADGLGEALKRAWQCNLFLSTIQHLAIQHLQVAPRAKPSWLSKISSRIWRRRIEVNLSSEERHQSPSTSESIWQVVVLNDPVNLMQYVTLVFQTVLGLPQGTAERHMREVHEQKLSIVWEGPRIGAEKYVQTLKAWHLNAIVRKRSPGVKTEVPLQVR